MKYMHYKIKKPKVRMVLSDHVVIDPEICHGKPTVNGTRIMVWQILESLERGESWKKISADWDGKVSAEAIREVIELAGRAFLEHAVEYGKESKSA